MQKKVVLKNFITLFILFLFFIFTLTGCSSEEKDLKTKTQEELSYIENQIITMMNHMNQITFSNYTLKEQLSKTKDESSNENSESASAGSSDSNQGSENSSTQTGGEDSSSENSGNSESNNSDTSQNEIKYVLKDNNVLLVDRTNVDWEYLKSNMEGMYAKWSTTLVDLHQLNINNEEILSFSNMLDQTTIAIKEEDKIKTLTNLANIYAYLPNYLKQFSDDQQKIDTTYIKSNLLNSYALVEQDRWDEVKTEITTAIESLSTNMNSVDTTTNYQGKTNKVYVLLNELNNTINLKDKDLYYMKYKSVMEEIANF